MIVQFTFFNVGRRSDAGAHAFQRSHVALAKSSHILVISILFTSFPLVTFAIFLHKSLYTDFSGTWRDNRLTLNKIPIPKFMNGLVKSMTFSRA